MSSYLAISLKLTGSFMKFEVTRLPMQENSMPDSLAQLALSLSMSDQMVILIKYYGSVP